MARPRSCFEIECDNCGKVIMSHFSEGRCYHCHALYEVKWGEPWEYTDGDEVLSAHVRKVQVGV